MWWSEKLFSTSLFSVNHKALTDTWIWFDVIYFFVIGQMAFPGSQGWIKEKNISCKNSNFLSFCVNISKYNELKSGVENITVGKMKLID